VSALRLFVMALVCAAFTALAFGATEHGTRTGPALPSLIASASDNLVEKDGTLSWKALGEVRTERRENTDGRYGRGIAYFAEPIVAPRVRELAGKKVRVTGYMLPRGTKDGVTRFFVSALPAADDDGCAAGDHATLVDVRMTGDPKVVVDRRVTVEGTLNLFDAQRWDGYIYKLSDARILEQ